MVVLLDDDNELRETLALALTEAGVADVCTVARLKDMRALGQAVLDCNWVVLDVNLGPHEPSGLEAARWLRKNGYNGGIIFLTGHAANYPHLRESCGELGATLIEKPAPLERLLATMVS